MVDLQLYHVYQNPIFIVDFAVRFFGSTSEGWSITSSHHRRDRLWWDLIAFVLRSDVLRCAQIRIELNYGAALQAISA